MLTHSHTHTRTWDLRSITFPLLMVVLPMFLSRSPGVWTFLVFGVHVSELRSDILKTAHTYVHTYA
jgi:hypothetical protein